MRDAEGMKNTYLNARPQVRNCGNCAHKINDPLGARFWCCAKAGLYCDVVRRSRCEDTASKCDANFSGWMPIPPKPPRRSLRQFLYDTLWA